jgi:transposase
MRKTLRRDAVSSFFANLPPCLIGMEASNGAHYWARALSELGHEVRLISPQFVKHFGRRATSAGTISATSIPPKHRDVCGRTARTI